MTTDQWVVILESSARLPEGEFDEHELRRLLEGLGDLRPIALHSPERYAVQVQVGAAGFFEAMALVMRRWRAAVESLGVRNPPLFRVEVLTLEEFERDCQMAYDGEGAKAASPAARGADWAGERLLRQVFNDPLTQLPAHTWFMSHLELGLQHAGPGLTQSLLILKLTGLDAVNQRWGRSAGDEVLVCAAQRLRAALPPGHAAARMGDDEFGVLLECESERTAVALADAVLTSLGVPIMIGDVKVSIPARAGIAFAMKGKRADGLIAEAKAALRASELSGQVELYRPGLPAGAESRPLMHGGHDPMGYVLLLQRAAMAANESTSLAHAASLVLSQVGVHIKSTVGHMYVVGSGGELLPGRLLHPTTSTHRALLELLDRLTLRPGEGLAGRVVQTGQPAWITDIGAESPMPWSDMALASGVHAALAFPVLVGREVVAVLELFAEKAWSPDAAMVEVLRCVGSQLGRVVERRRAQDSLRASEWHMRQAQQLAQLGSWYRDDPKGEGTWNDGMNEILGLPADAPHDLDLVMRLVHAEDRPRVLAAVEEVFESGRYDPLEFRVVRPDGQVRWVSARANASRDEAGAIVGVYGTLLDITHVKTAEEALRKRERQLTMAEELAELGSWERDLATNRMEWSNGMFGLWGADPRTFEPTLDAVTSQIHPEDRERMLRGLAQALETGRFAADFRVTPAHGCLRWFRFRNSVQYDDEGRPVTILGTMQDFTREKVAEQELRVSEQRYRAIVENMHGGVWETDADGTTTYVNDRTAELLGRPREEILGRPLTDFLEGEAAAAYHRRLPGRQQGVREQFETTVTRSDGTQLPVLVAANALFDEHGRFIGSLATVNDVSRWHSDDDAFGGSAHESPDGDGGVPAEA